LAARVFQTGGEFFERFHGNDSSVSPDQTAERVRVSTLMCPDVDCYRGWLNQPPQFMEFLFVSLEGSQEQL
jgi:hypothetical protein